MTESGIIQLVTLVLAAIAPIVMLWAKSKFEKKLEVIKEELNDKLGKHDVLDVQVQASVEHVIEQNKVQEAKIGEVYHMVNSELAAWKVTMEKNLTLAVARATAEGLARGVEQERGRTAVTAEEVVAKAEAVAEQVLAVAAEVKDKGDK